MPRTEVWPAMVLSIGTTSPADASDGALRYGLRFAPQRLDSRLHGGQLAGSAVKLFEHVLGAHVVGPQVVGDGVQRMDGLVVVVAPPAHLAGELHGGRAVDDDEARALARRIGGQLQEDAHEVGERHVEG